MEQSSGSGMADGDNKSVPFQRYVELKRGGGAVSGLPLPANSGKYSSRATRVVTSVILLAFVMAGIFYLSRNSAPPTGAAVATYGARSSGGSGSGSMQIEPVGGGGSEAVALAGPVDQARGSANAGPADTTGTSSARVPSGAAAGSAVAPGAVGTESASGAPIPPSGALLSNLPPVKHYPIGAGQFVDLAEDRPPRPKVKGELRNGDTVTVMPSRTRGYDFLYWVVFGPTDQFRLSRIYPKDMLKHSAAPLKFTVRDAQDGAWQAVLIASEQEIATIQNIIQDANLAPVQKEAAREARLNRLVDGLSRTLPEGTWSHKVTPELKYFRQP